MKLQLAHNLSEMTGQKSSAELGNGGNDWKL
jgi:hypothetical protein